MVTNIDNVRAAFPKVQLCFEAGGSEIASHKLRAALFSANDGVVISDDLPNAFNLRSRVKMLRKLFSIPALAPLFRFTFLSYSSPADLLLLDDQSLVQHVLASAEGVRQGDPLALFLFALSMQDSFALAESVEGVAAVAIADDLEIVGEPAAAFEAFDLVREHQLEDGVQRDSKKRLNLPCGFMIVSPHRSWSMAAVVASFASLLGHARPMGFGGAAAPPSSGRWSPHTRRTSPRGGWPRPGFLTAFVRRSNTRRLVASLGSPCCALVPLGLITWLASPPQQCFSRPPNWWMKWSLRPLRNSPGLTLGAWITVG